ncbi:ComF family protein [Marinilactibacillus kalidii]|uniref:ComF family protein n=1 Tax=Marinilactibacillus kalidii TaxID=2820274 RepID=UPI001ABE0917|nr:ComF family protein [Marinilactibacillus kalidii]
MTNCLWCNQAVINPISLLDILAFKPIKEKPVCGNCYVNFEQIMTGESCPVCSRSQVTQEVCADCRRWKEIYPDMHWRHHALFKYNAFAKEWMEKYKFTGDIRIAAMVSNDLSKKISSLKKVDFIVPIPISKKSYAQRGFNQVAILLKKANISSVATLENLTVSEQQSKKNRAERLKGRQPFRLTIEKKRLRNKSVLIVDDVYTTGRTILFAAECLAEAGVKDIQTLSLFR